MKPSTSQSPRIPSDIVAKATDIYSTLTALTDSPRDAQSMILIIHILLWVNCKSAKTSVDAMLADYCDNFKANLRENGMIEDIEQ